jgi:MFS family permease
MSNGARAFSFINAAHFCDHYMLLVYPTAVLTLAPLFGIGYGAGIAITTGTFVCFGLLSLPAGWLGDHWSRRHMLGVFFLGGGAALIATALTQGIWSLAAALTLVGLFAAIYHPVGTAMLSTVKGVSGRAFGMNGVFGNLGVAAAPLITGALIQAVGWRWAFALPGLAFIAVGLAYLALVPAGTGEAVRRAAAKERYDSAPDFALVAVVLAVTVAAGGFTFNTVTITLPRLVAEDAPGIAAMPVLIGGLATLIYLAGALTQIIVGKLIDTIAIEGIFAVLGLMQLAGFIGVAMLEGSPALAAAALILAAVYGQVVVNDLLIARTVPDQWRARAYAARYLLGFTTAASVVPLIAWLHTPQAGLAPVYAVMSLFAAAVAAAAVAYWVRMRRAGLPQMAE